MKLDLIIVILSFLIGAMYIGHSAHVFERSHIPIDESQHIYYHIQTEFLKFLLFFPSALFYFAIAICIIGFPNNNIPYFVFIGFTVSLLLITTVNAFMGDPYPQLNITTKYGHYIDFPLVRTIQLAALLVILYMYVKKPCSSQ